MSSRPSRNAAAPPPQKGVNVLNCHTCGRIITPRHSHLKVPKSTPPKFCSDKCRARKPRYPPTNRLLSASAEATDSSTGVTTLNPNTWSLEARIEASFVDLLDGVQDGVANPATNAVKKQGRRTVMCDEVEALIFGDGTNTLLPNEMVSRQKQKKKKRGLPETSPSDEPFGSSMADGGDVDDYAIAEEVGGVPIYLDYAGDKHKGITDSNAKSSTPLPTEVDLQRRRAGQEKADQRELVRQAGRRGVAFGFWHPYRLGGKDRQGTWAGNEGQGETEEARRRVEIVQRGKVVEGSFAKGDWGVRWVD